MAPARHLGLPSLYLTLIFTVDEPLTIAQHVDPTQSPGDYLAMIGGLHTSPAVVEHDGAQSGIQLRVSPLGARALFGLPAGELASIDVHASEIIGSLGRDLQERPRAAPTWRDRFALLDRRPAEPRLSRPSRAKWAGVSGTWPISSVPRSLRSVPSRPRLHRLPG